MKIHYSKYLLLINSLKFSFVFSSTVFSTLYAQQNPGSVPNQTVGNDPNFDPSGQTGSENYIKPSLNEFPSVSPTESTPSDPSGKVPFGTNENYSFVDKSFLGSEGSEPNTNKIDLIQSGVSADDISEYSNDLLDLVGKVGGDKKKSEQVRKNLSGKSGLVEKLFKISVSNPKIDQDRMLKRSADEIDLISQLNDTGTDPDKAFELTEKFDGGSNSNEVGKKALEIVRDFVDVDIFSKFLTVEPITGDKNAPSMSNLVNNISSASSGAMATKFKAKTQKIFKIADIGDNKAKSEILYKLSRTDTGRNPIQQLVLLDEKIIENIASIKSSSTELANQAVNELKSSAFSSTIGNVDTDNLNIQDINSIFNQFDKLEKTGLGGNSNYEELREQIASIIVLDVVSDNFKIEVIGSDGTSTAVSAPLQFSDISEKYGSAVLNQIEGLTSSASIVEEMNELNPSLFTSHVSDNPDFDHHSLINQELSNRLLGRRSSDQVNESVNPLTVIKEFQRDTIIDQVLSKYSNSLPVGKSAIQNILTPGSDSEEHHHEEAMNSDSLSSFAAYVDDVVPDELEAVGSSGRSASTNQFTNVRSRLSSVRLAQMGYPVSDGLVDLMVAKAIRDLENADNLLTSSGGLNDEFARKALSKEAAKLKNGFFVQASVSFSEDKLHKMDGDSWGLTFGVDEEIIDNGRLGLMAGLGKADSSGSGLKVETDSLFLGVYGNKVFNDYYVEAFSTIGTHDSDTKRTENSGAVMGASPNSKQFTANINAGRSFEYESFLITPHVGLTYDKFITSQYTESELTPSPLGIPSSASQLYEKEVDSLILSVGGKIAHYHYLLNGGIIIPEFRASWEKNFKAKVVNQQVHLLSHGSKDSYFINGRPEDDNHGILGVGVTYLNPEGKSLYLHYDYMVGKADFEVHNLNLGLRILF